MRDRKGDYPGGRPYHGQPLKRLSIERVPPREPLTPGLRYPALKDAIGFHHAYSTQEGDE